MDFGDNLRLKKDWVVNGCLTLSKGDVVQVVFYRHRAYIEFRFSNVGSLLRFSFNHNTRDKKIEEYFEKVVTEETIERLIGMLNEAEQVTKNPHEKEKALIEFKKSYAKEFSILSDIVSFDYINDIDTLFNKCFNRGMNIDISWEAKKGWSVQIYTNYGSTNSLKTFFIDLYTSKEVIREALRFMIKFEEHEEKKNREPMLGTPDD